MGYKPIPKEEEQTTEIKFNFFHVVKFLGVDSFASDREAIFLVPQFSLNSIHY